VLRTQERTPVRALDVADVGNRRRAKLRWTRKPPTHLRPLQLAALAELEHWPVAFREDFEQRVAKQRVDARLAPFVEAPVVARSASFADVGGIAIAHDL